MKLSDFLSNVGRPVAYYPALRSITGSTTATILLCWLIDLAGTGRDGQDGWIQKSSSQIEEETGLSYEEQKTARAKLRQAGLLEERHARLEHAIYFRPNLDRLVALHAQETVQ